MADCSDDEDLDLSYDQFVVKHQHRIPFGFAVSGPSGDDGSEDGSTSGSAESASESSVSSEEKGDGSDNSSSDGADAAFNDDDSLAALQAGCVTFEDFEDLKKHVQAAFKCNMSSGVTGAGICCSFVDNNADNRKCGVTYGCYSKAQR